MGSELLCFSVASDAARNIFQKGSPCEDDPDGTIYPEMNVITDHYFRGVDRLLELLPAVDDATMQQQNPIEAARERFPTVGIFVVFLVGAHTALHLGQVSTWRRCMGLGSVS